MKYILKILISALIVVALSEVLPGVNVESYVTAIVVALIISFLNILVKPVLVILTLPVTIITLGLFLVVINTLIIVLADKLVKGFYIDSIWQALLFSILLSLIQSIFFSLLKEDKKV